MKKNNSRYVLLIIIGIQIVFLLFLIFYKFNHKSLYTYKPSVDNKFDKILEEYTEYLTLIKINDNTLTVGPYDYDGKHNEKLSKYELDDNVEFYQLSVSSKEDGNYSFSELTKEEFENLLSISLLRAFLWKDNSKIIRIVVYEENLVYTNTIEEDIKNDFHLIFENNTSTNPYDYINNDYFKKIIEYGDDSVNVLISMYKNNEFGELTSNVAALAIKTIKECNFEFNNSEEFFRSYEQGICRVDEE